MIRRWPRHKFMLRFLVPYLCVLMIAMIIGSYSYINILEIVESDTKEDNLSALEQSQSIVNRRLAEIEGMVTHLAIRKKSADLLELPGYHEPGAVEKIADIQQEITLYNQMNTYINSIYIYLHASDVVISSFLSQHRADQFYGSFFRYGNLGLPEWKDYMLRQYHSVRQSLPIESLTLNGQPSRSVIYMQSVPLDRYKDPKGTVIVILNRNELDKLFTPLINDKDGWVVVTDKDGNEITTVSSANAAPVPVDPGLFSESPFAEQTLDGEPMLLTYTESAYNGWKYMAVIPKRIVLQKVENVRQFILATLGLTLLIGILAAYALAYRSSQPIRDLFKTFREKIETTHAHGKNEFETLKQSISSIIDSNHLMQARLEEQKPHMRAIFFHRLIHGQFGSAPDIEALSSFLNFNLRDSRLLLAIIRINGYRGNLNQSIMNELSASKVKLKEALSQTPGRDGYFQDIDFDKIVVLLRFDKRDAYADHLRYMEELAARIYALCERNQIRISFACGSIVESPHEASRSFDEANQALEYKLAEHRLQLIWYKDLPKTSDCYHYPLESENRLMSMIKSGDSAGPLQLLDTLFAENTLHRRLSLPSIRNFVFDLQGTFMKVLEQIQTNDEQFAENIRKKLERGEFCASMSEMRQLLSQICEEICDKVDEQKKSRNSHLKEAMIAHMQTNFRNPNLSLASLSEQFDLKETYVSQFFKEQIGENFSDCLERLRLEQATRLLREQTATIEQVACEVGYYSAHTFRRAFKRVYGITPVMYRESRLPPEHHLPV